jgi:hypothetical protein
MSIFGRRRQRLFLTTYPPAWLEEVLEERHYVEDPIHAACARTPSGLAWDRVGDVLELSSRQRSILKRARDHDLAAGYSLPIRTPGEPEAIFTVARPLDEPLDAAEILTARLLGSVAYDRARELLGEEMRTLAFVSLSPRQVDASRSWPRVRAIGRLPRFSGLAATPCTNMLNPRVGATVCGAERSWCCARFATVISIWTRSSDLAWAVMIGLGQVQDFCAVAATIKDSTRRPDGRNYACDGLSVLCPGPPYRPQASGELCPYRRLSAGLGGAFQARRLYASDPIHRASHRTNVGFAWSAVQSIITLSAADRSILAEAYDAGLGDGFTVPAHIPGEVNGSCSFAMGGGRSARSTTARSSS